MAQAKHKPTEKSRGEAGAYAAVGVPHRDIALLMGINLRTLLKYYRHEMDLGKAKANAQVGKRLWKEATEGTFAGAAFWAKSQMGWREVEAKENIHRFPDGVPTQQIDIYAKAVAVTFDPIEAQRNYLKLIQGD